MATIALANENNFLRFYKVTGALTLSGLQALAGSTLLSGEMERFAGNDGLPFKITQGSNAPSTSDSTAQEHIFKHIKYTTPIYPSDVLSFYVNLSTLETNANFATWTVSLLHEDSFTIAYPSVVSLTKDIISGTDYRFYSSAWTVPSALTTGCYRMVILDGTTVLYISNVLEGEGVEYKAIETAFIRYRNDVNIQNFNYEILTTFYNIFRVRMFSVHPKRPITSEGYDLVSGNFQRVRTSVAKTFDFYTNYMDEAAQDAFEFATIHSDLQVWENNDWVAYQRPGGNEYNNEFQDEYPLIEGVVSLEQTAYASSNKTL